MRIALSGYYGFDNAGDEALLSAITSSIRKITPQADFVVFSGSPARTTARHAIRAVNYLDPWAVGRELNRCDLLISGGGSIFQDVTSWRSLPYYIAVVALAKLLGKTVVFYAQGVGPIQRSISKFLMRLVANRVDLITVRDEKSKQLLLDLGVTLPPLRVTADPVFSLQPNLEDEAQITVLLKKLNPQQQALVGVSVRKWPSLDGYQVRLASYLDELIRRDYRVIFIPMAYPQDIAESIRVIELMEEEPALLDLNLNSQEHLALIGHLDLMIAMRLHALIFAANQGVPFAGISYDPKVEAFLSSFGLRPLSRDYENMKNELDQLLEDKSVREKIKDQSWEMRYKSEENARLAISLLPGQSAFEAEQSEA